MPLLGTHSRKVSACVLTKTLARMCLVALIKVSIHRKMDKETGRDSDDEPLQSYENEKQINNT